MPTRLLQCGIVNRVVEALSSTGAITTINDLNTHFAVGAGGFAGSTNPSFVYTVIDDGPNGASIGDIKVLTDSLGYVMSQASAFLLDADNTSNFDFPANYVVLNFATPPSIAKSAALFRTVGRIDPDLFSTDTSGYTQFGRAYLSLQSDVSDAQFIAGYTRAAAEFGVEYTPIVNGAPSLFQGGAAFPGNDWVAEPARRGVPVAHSAHRATGRSPAFARSTSAPLRRSSASSRVTTSGRRTTWSRSTAGKSVASSYLAGPAGQNCRVVPESANWRENVVA